MKTLCFALLAAAVLAVPALQDDDGGEKEPQRPQVGAPAPAIRLNDHTGRAVALGPGGEETWSVLAFFPKAMTPG